MKIAVVTTDNRQDYRTFSEPEPSFGAAPEALLQGFAAIPEIEVHVLSCAQEPMKSPDKIAPNVWFHSLHVPKLGWMRTFYQGCVRAVRRRLKAIGPDIVHGQGSERECAISAVFSGFPNVVTIHGNMAELARLFNAPFGSFPWLAGKLENVALRRTAGVFCNSAYTESLVKPRAKHTWRVPNALRNEFFENLPQRGKAPKCIVVNVGVISRRKRQLELVQMARRMHDQGLKFEIQFIGIADKSDAYIQDFLREVAAAEKEGFARYLGLLPGADVIKRFDEAHGLVHFPSEEAFGLVVAEAMARKLKFFGARLGGIKEIADVPQADLFKPDDWKGLETAVSAWIKSGFSEPAGPELVMAARYHPKVVAQRHLEIYREVLSKSR